MIKVSRNARVGDNLVAGVDAVGGRVGVVGCGLSVVHDDEVVDNLTVVEVASVGDPVVAVTLRFTV